MDRKEFLSAIGITAASFALINCVGCSKKSDGSASGVSGPSGVDFTLDLTTSANSVLLTNGGYLASNGVIVAKTTAGTYTAFSNPVLTRVIPWFIRVVAGSFTVITMGPHLQKLVLLKTRRQTVT